MITARHNFITAEIRRLVGIRLALGRLRFAQQLTAPQLSRVMAGGLMGVKEEDQRPPLPSPACTHLEASGSIFRRRGLYEIVGIIFPFEPAALAQGWQPISALHRLPALPWTRILNTARRELDGPTYTSQQNCIPTKLLIFIGQTNLSGPFNSVTFCRQGGLLNRFHRPIRG